jgi:2-polyprenyl-3-methyl-5-hydroxy-6-metoxy-1,4-benzoquinol methylase
MADTRTSNCETLSKSERVKAVFEKPQRYLTRWQTDIRIRAETAKAFAAGFQFERVLDIGCGDGSVSLPLANRLKHITLLDLSASMAALASSKVPPELAENVDVRNEDFMRASFGGRRFDLIVCMGVLAHVDSPDAFVAKVASLLESGGHLILEFTDASHFLGRVIRLLTLLREMLAPSRSSVNLLSSESVARLTERHGLRPVSEYRYCQLAVPGLRFFGHRVLYWAVRSLFGSAGRSRNGWLGNEYICLFTARHSDASTNRGSAERP